MSVAIPVVDSFNGEERKIYLKQGVTEFHWVTDIYTEYRKERVDVEDFRKWSPLLSAEGYESKGAGKFTARFVKLLEGTKVVPYDEFNIITALGEAITDNADVDPTLFDTSGLTNTVTINITPPTTEIIVEEVPVSQETLDQLTADITDGINNPADPQEQYHIIENYFQKFYKKTQYYNIKMNSALRDTLEIELSTSPLTSLSVAGVHPNIVIDETITDNNFIAYGYN